MIPIAALLIPYALFLLIFLFFSFVNLYHLIKFGSTNFVAFMATFLFLAGSVLILYTSYTYIINTDWTRTIDVIPDLSAPTYAP